MRAGDAYLMNGGAEVRRLGESKQFRLHHHILLEAPVMKLRKLVVARLRPPSLFP